MTAPIIRHTDIHWTLEAPVPVPVVPGPALPDGHLPDALDLLAAGEAEAVEQVVTLAGEAQSYRLLAQSAMAHAAEVTRDRDRLRRQLAALRDELRRYTAAAVTGRREAA